MAGPWPLQISCCTLALVLLFICIAYSSIAASTIQSTNTTTYTTTNNTTIASTTTTTSYQWTHTRDWAGYISIKVFDMPISGCSGLGNMMYRHASLLALGMRLNRTVYYDPYYACMKKAKEEALNIFPEYGYRILMLHPTSPVKRVKFANNCCRYEDPTPLESVEETWLELAGDGYVLGDYRFFEQPEAKEAVVQTFQCSEGMRTRSKKLRDMLLGPNHHIMCVHTRQGDFNNYGAQSKVDFTLLAIRYAHTRLRDHSRFGLHQSPPINITTVFLGDDPAWNRERAASLPKCYRPRLLPNQSRGEDMCFGIEQCNSLVLTAGASTYGWWMGYLMRARWEGNPEKVEGLDGEVFYNGELEKELSGGGMSTAWSRSNFPEDWVALRKVPEQANLGTWVESME